MYEDVVCSQCFHLFSCPLCNGPVKSLTLKRIATNEDGTYGVLIDQTTPFTLTLEDPWLANQKDISCIPAGSYLCKRVDSPKFGDTFEIMDVPHRDHILFHWGNTEEDTRGCPLIGEEFGFLNEKMAVLSSKRGFDEFLERTKQEDEFLITILWV